MQSVSASPVTAEGVVRLEPRAFRWRRDGATVIGLVALIGFCLVMAVAWGHAAGVLGVVYGAMALLVWGQSFRSSWAVSADVLAARRWAAWHTVAAGDVATVEVDPGEPGVDVSVAGRSSDRVVVPLDDWRRRPGAVDGLRQFLTRAERTGAVVDPAVWRAIDRP